MGQGKLRKASFYIRHYRGEFDSFATTAFYQHFSRPVQILSPFNITQLLQPLTIYFIISRAYSRRCFFWRKHFSIANAFVWVVCVLKFWYGCTTGFFLFKLFDYNFVHIYPTIHQIPAFEYTCFKSDKTAQAHPVVRTCFLKISVLMFQRQMRIVVNKHCRAYLVFGRTGNLSLR